MKCNRVNSIPHLGLRFSVVHPRFADVSPSNKGGILLHEVKAKYHKDMKSIRQSRRNVEQALAAGKRILPITMMVK